MCFRVWGELTEMDSMKLVVFQVFRQPVKHFCEISLSDYNTMPFMALLSVKQVSLDRVVCLISVLIVKVDKYLLERKGFRVRHDKVNREHIVSFVFITLVDDYISVSIRYVYPKLTSQKRHFAVIGAVEHKYLLRFI